MRIPEKNRRTDRQRIMMRKKRTEQSIIGRINDMSHKLVVMLVIPIIISLLLMIFYATQYHSSIVRMETIANLKKVVEEDIPEAAWDIVSGRQTFAETGIYSRIKEVNTTIESISDRADQENRLSLIIAGRTMQTLKNYVDLIRENIENNVPVVENEAIQAEIRNVGTLVGSMLNDYIEQEISLSARMSISLMIVIIVTAVSEILIVITALLLRSRSMKNTSTFVRQPIERLEEVTSMLADGTLDARITDTDVTELRNLTLQVNTMADHLETMMEKSVRDAKNLRKAELRTLQAQINPHFLYNTLEAIVWKAEAGDKDEVIRLTSALSDFFRISLSSGADWIPISQEKKHIEGYLKIQQTRYRDILKYEIDIPDDIGDFYILKLMLQPLVENALYHGIKIKRGGGTISVKGRVEDGNLVFSVKDTGYGMTPEQLSQLSERMKKGQPTVTERSGGFGLVNVNLRIRLYYNQTDGLKITSGPEGTDVEFKVPCRTREEITENEGVSG